MARAPSTPKPKSKRNKKHTGGHHKEKGGSRSSTPRDRHKGKQTGGMQEVMVLLISGTTEEGDLTAKPASWDSRREPPHIVVIESGRHARCDAGDRVLARLRKVEAHLYQALVIRVLPGERAQSIVGVFVRTSDGGIIEPISRKMKESFLVTRADTENAEHGELVTAETLPGIPSMSMRYARVTERLGSADNPRAASLMAAQMHELPATFSEAALAEADHAESPVLHEGREDIRHIPLVTIDGEDARDFDDAVFAERDGDGWHLVVAIADVAHYVAEGSALDAAAFERGNSVYFPDRVIPMLPERLSNGLCSLNPEQDRYCLAAHIWIDAHGTMTRYQFLRGLMRSRARLTYTLAQSCHDAQSGELYDSIIAPLYGAYAALANERDKRGALDLNLPEYKILFDGSGKVAAIAPRERLESHRLIETFMIAANVAAADFLLKKKLPAIYRVHETPAEEKVEELQMLLKMAGHSLHVGAGLRAAHFNRVLRAVVGKPEEFLVNTAILRSQMQAYYSPECLGHFGLSLQKYCHFTSPIRRYADLVVHRSLAEAIGHTAPPTKRPPKREGHRNLTDVALHISDTERRAMMAERDASDRYKVSFMSQHVGGTFSGVITSLNEYGLFVALNDSGVTGFMPVRNLPGDFFHYDRRSATFKGQRTRQTFQLGQPLIIRIQSANAITGSLIFEMATPNPHEQQGQHGHTSRKQQGKEREFHHPKPKPAWMKKQKRRHPNAEDDAPTQHGRRSPKPRRPKR